MMRQMRRSAPWIMGILVIAFVGWMVFQVGMDVTGQGGGQANGAIAKVNGVTIDAQTFYSAVRNAQEQARQDQGAAPTSLQGTKALEDAVLENLIQDILLRQEFRKRDIRVTDREVVEAARTTPPPEIMRAPEFQTDGRFDPNKYSRFLSANPDPNFLLALEERYRDELPRIKLYDQLTSDIYLSRARLWSAYRDQNDSADAIVLRIEPNALVPDTAVVVTDEEVAAYYGEHRKDFEKPKRAFTSYIRVSRETNPADTLAALERARAIVKELRGGADFADVARRESSDSVSAKDGGDLGEATRGKFVKEFEEAALKLRPGQISDPVLSPFGYHIIKLESRSKGKYHPWHILIPIELAGEHLELVEGKADTLDIYAAEQTEPEALDDAAGMLGLTPRPAPPISDGNTAFFVDGDYVPDAAVWVFDVLPGESSPVIESKKYYYIFRLDSLQEAGVPPLDQVREEVKAALVQQKKKDRALEIVNRVRNRIDKGENLARAARHVGIETSTFKGVTRRDPPNGLFDAPEAVGLIFRLNPGESGGPVESAGTYFFAETLRKVVADSSAFETQYASLRNQALQTARQTRVQLVMNSIRQNADVNDRRRELEHRQRELAQQQGIPGIPSGF